MAPHYEPKYFRLKARTIAMLAKDGQKTVQHIPAGAVLKVCHPLEASMQSNRQVEVEWQDQTITMFATDILERGEMLAQGGAGKAGSSGAG